MAGRHEARIQVKIPDQRSTGCTADEKREIAALATDYIRHQQHRQRSTLGSSGNRHRAGRMTTTSWPADLAQWVLARPWLGVVAATAIVVAVISYDQVLAWRHRRLTAGARWLTIAVPPEVTAQAAAVFWTLMVGALTPPAWRRRVFGYPHVGWEYTWTGRSLTIRVWVPATVPLGAVEAAVRAAWPAATLTVSDTAAPIPTDVGVEVGGAYWPQRGDGVPLRTVHDTDPLRALFAAGA
ncbi:hypothetical protein AB0N23_37160, partial [Streptomyces sp. NPDC052644]